MAHDACTVSKSSPIPGHNLVELTAPPNIHVLHLNAVLLSIIRQPFVRAARRHDRSTGSPSRHAQPPARGPAHANPSRRHRSSCRASSSVALLESRFRSSAIANSTWRSWAPKTSNAALPPSTERPSPAAPCHPLGFVSARDNTQAGRRPRSSTNFPIVNTIARPCAPPSTSLAI